MFFLFVKFLRQATWTKSPLAIFTDAPMDLLACKMVSLPFAVGYIIFSWPCGLLQIEHVGSGTLVTKIQLSITSLYMLVIIKD
jgi:hypothetical protein